jgi:N-methylhydantoinase A
VNRDELGVGFELVGPAIIDEQTATTVVPPSWKVRVDEIGTLVLSRVGRAT